MLHSGSLITVLDTVLPLLMQRAAAPPPPPRTGGNFALLALAGGGIVAGLVLANVALHTFLSGLYADDLAALLTAGAVFAEALAALGLRALLQQRNKEVATAAPQISPEEIQKMLGELYEGFEEPVRENPKTAVALAAVAGMLLGRRLH